MPRLVADVVLLGVQRAADQRAQKVEQRSGHRDALASLSFESPPLRQTGRLHELLGHQLLDAHLRLLRLEQRLDLELLFSRSCVAGVELERSFDVLQRLVELGQPRVPGRGSGVPRLACRKPSRWSRPS